MDKSVVDQLLTVRDWIRWASSEFTRAGLFFGHGTDNAWDEAMMLVLGLINQPWDRCDAIIDTRLTVAEKELLIAAIQDRIEKRIPAAYLVGEAPFAGLTFRVTEDVLVPRSPIAELIANEFQPWLEVYPQHILDLCTGSGCIGIACAFAFPEAEVDLSDLSTKALDVARSNIERFALADRVQAIHSDVFANIPPKKYQLIVSNPPYVDAEDLASMPAEYRAEPAMGLGSGDDGLDITRQILSHAAKYLSDDGLLVVEVGNSWPALEAAYPDVPFMWPEFENGGHGVFVLTSAQINEYFNSVS